MGGKDAAVAVQQGQRSILRLPGPRAACHLTMRLDKVGHGSRDAAMAVGEQAAMGVERQFAVMIEVAGLGAGPRLAAAAQADLFQKDRQRDGEAVVDRGVADIPKRYPGSRPGAFDRFSGAEPRQAGGGADVLMRMRLTGTDDPDTGVAGPLPATTKASPPSETGQQSRIFSGVAMGFEAITSATVIGCLNCAPGCISA